VSGPKRLHSFQKNAETTRKSDNQWIWHIGR
jgi:hypothetical protein